MRRALAAIASVALLLAGAVAAHAQQLIVDISQHLVAITTGFTGADVLLFGTREGSGDIVVVVRGPDVSATVRRKDRLAGVWLNTERMVFPQVPAFYHVAASGKLAGDPMVQVLDTYGLGGELLNAMPAGKLRDPVKVDAFRDALIRRKQAAALYAVEAWPVTFIGESLFRTTIPFPSNVPTGRYSIEVYSLENDRIAEMTSTPLIVGKAGFGAAVYDFAHENAAAYGLVAIAVAVMSGWLAGTIFRKA